MFHFFRVFLCVSWFLCLVLFVVWREEEGADGGYVLAYAGANRPQGDDLDELLSPPEADGNTHTPPPLQPCPQPPTPNPLHPPITIPPPPPQPFP